MDDDLIKLHKVYQALIEEGKPFKEHLFSLVKVCPVCGEALVLTENDESKYCPEGDGHASISESADGLPAIVFQFRGEALR